jgi:hypothetical protein
MLSALLFISVFLLIWGVNYVTKRRKPGATLQRQIRRRAGGVPRARAFTEAEKQRIREAERALWASRETAESDAPYPVRLSHYNEMIDQFDAVKRIYQAAARPEVEAVEQRRQDVLLERTALVHAHLETLTEETLAQISALADKDHQQERLAAFVEHVRDEGVYATHEFLEDLGARIHRFATRHGLRTAQPA